MPRRRVRYARSACFDAKRRRCIFEQPIHDHDNHDNCCLWRLQSQWLLLLQLWYMNDWLMPVLMTALSVRALVRMLCGKVCHIACDANNGSYLGAVHRGDH